MGIDPVFWESPPGGHPPELGQPRVDGLLGGYLITKANGHSGRFHLGRDQQGHPLWELQGAMGGYPLRYILAFEGKTPRPESTSHGGTHPRHQEKRADCIGTETAPGGKHHGAQVSDGLRIPAVFKTALGS